MNVAAPLLASLRLRGESNLIAEFGAVRDVPHGACGPCLHRVVRQLQCAEPQRTTRTDEGLALSPRAPCNLPLPALGSSSATLMPQLPRCGELIRQRQGQPPDGTQPHQLSRGGRERLLKLELFKQIDHGLERQPGQVHSEINCACAALHEPLVKEATAG